MDSINSDPAFTSPTISFRINVLGDHGFEPASICREFEQSGEAKDEDEFDSVPGMECPAVFDFAFHGIVCRHVAALYVSPSLSIVQKIDHAAAVVRYAQRIPTLAP